MTRGPMWLSLLLGLAVFGLVASQTLAGLGVTGAFGWRVAPVRVEVHAAYRAIEGALEHRDHAPRPGTLRDPFLYSRVVAASSGPSRPRTGTTPARAQTAPLLTAIVWDDDPRALVRWNSREWTIREGGLFDEFQVVRISRDQVTLRRGEATLLLKRPNPGE